MQDKTKKILKYALSLAVAGLLLYFSFRGVKWEDFIQGLRNCRWEFILMSMTAGIVAFWLRGLRWRIILLPIDPATRRITTFNAVNIGYIANFVFPRIGEFVRCGVVSARSSEAKYDKVLGSVVLERAWDMITMLLVTVILLVCRWERFGSFFVEKMWQPISESLNFSLWWIVLLLVLVLAACIWAVWAFRDRSKFCAKVCSVILGIWDGFTSGFRMKGKGLFLLYTLLIWVMYWLMAVFTMKSIPDLDYLNMTDALFLMVAGSFGWLVPVPGGFGSFHFIVSLALSTIYGIPAGLGIVFATLSHESQAITMALCGGISYFHETIFRKK